MKRIAICLGLLLGSAALSHAQPLTGRAARTQALGQFRAAHPEWDAQVDEKTGSVSSLLGGRVTDLAGTPEQKALAFLARERGLFGLEDAARDLEVTASRSQGHGGTQVILRQRHRGVPVLHSGFLVAFDRRGALHFVSADVLPDVAVEKTAPSLTGADALARARADLGVVALAQIKAPELVIHADRSGEAVSYRLAYAFEVETRDQLQAWAYVVDAQRGEVLSKTNLITDLEGSGLVYATNPLHGTPVSKPLRRLLNLSPVRLDGEHLVVNRLDAPSATSPDGVFNYATTDARFDEVMVYHHSDEFEAWLSARGLPATQVGKVTAITRFVGSYASARPWVNEVRFSDGSQYSGLNNPTKEEAAIAHEYMHVVSETYNTLAQSPQGPAMDEGYSDHFAIGYRHSVGGVASTAIFEYADQPGGCSYKRDSDNNAQLNQYGTNIDGGCSGVSPHDGGMILSGALWDFRTSTGLSPNVADEIALASLAYLDNYPDFYDARNAIAAAAYAMDHTGYICASQNAFASHGIGGTCPPAVVVIGPESLEFKEYGTWTAYASGGSASPNGTFTYAWYFRSVGDPSWTATGVSAQTYTRRMEGTSFEVRADATGGGGTASDVQLVLYGSPCGGCLKAGPDVLALLPDAYSLDAPRPNPFGAQTELRFALPEAARIRLAVYDVLGREVAVLADGDAPAGTHVARFEAASLPAGVYVYRFEARGSSGTFVRSGTVTLVR